MRLAPAARRRRGFSVFDSARLVCTVVLLLLGYLVLSTGGASVPAGSMAAHGVQLAAATSSQAPVLDRTGWTASASSQETAFGDGRASLVLDGAPGTSWHNQFTGVTPTLPQWIQLDMKTARDVSGLVYTPSTGTSNGRIGQYEVTLSTDGTTWSAPVTSGLWADDLVDKTAAWTTTSARFVRLRSFTDAGNRGPFATAGELNVLGAGAVTVPATSGGSWTPLRGLPLIPAAGALLPGNRVLVWSARYTNTYSPGGGQTETAIIDLNTGTVSQRLVTNTGHDMFCPGVAILPDGRIMVTGGNDAPKTSVYDPATDSWASGANMNIPRGYHSMTTLASGKVITIGGSWSGGAGPRTAEVWSEATGWRTLAGVPAEAISTADKGGPYRADNHAWLYPVSGGRVLQVGPSKEMHWITTEGAGTITSAGLRGDDGDAMNGNAVMFDADKILTLGGAVNYDVTNATARSYVIDASGATPRVTRQSDLAYKRRFSNAVALPDGQVLAIGGAELYDSDGVLAPEVWSPVTGRWTTLAPMAVTRTYHSFGMLLPDAKVLAGGGGLCPGCGFADHPDYQVFTPPYLLNGDGTPRARPAITNAPPTATPGATIQVTTDRAVTSFSMVRYGEATHSVDNDQRRFAVTIESQAGNTYTLRVPADGGVALPGPYMLFAMDAAGTPSVSTRVVVPVAASAVPAPEPANLAKGKPATQSSTAYEGVASRAVDGNTGGGYVYGSVTHTDQNAQPWWQVDLGSAKSLDTVTLWNRTDCCTDRLTNGTVFVSTTDMTGRTYAQLRADASIKALPFTTLTGPTLALKAGGFSGRYVRVQLSGTQYLNLAEVEVTEADLAQGRPATQSSTILDAFAGRAVDGNTDGTWTNGSVTHTEPSAQPWWQVDLGSANPVGTVTLWNRTDCCSDRLANGTVFVSTTDMTGRTYAQLQADTTVKALPFTSVTGAKLGLAAGGFTGRYVRVQLSGSQPLSLAEIQVSRATAGSNTAPVARVGPPQAVSTGATVSLDGSMSSDLDGNPLTYRWTQTAGPVVTLTGATTARPTFTAPSISATLAFTLVVNDGAADSAAAATSVTVTATAPVVNLAQGRPATQSSTVLDAPASRAVDGTTDGVWANGSVTHTELKAQPWWQVDLGSAKPLDTVTVWNRSDCCADRLTGGTVLISTTDMTGRTFAQLQADPSIKALPLPTLTGPSLALKAAGFTGRYVRVQLPGTQYLHLAEVQVTPAATPVPNLAQGRPTTQSSTAFDSPSARAVDGNTDGAWANGSVTHTDVQAQPWWQVDLGSATPVGTVTLWNRTDSCCTFRLANGTVFVSPTDMTGRAYAQLQADASVKALPFTSLSGPSLALPAGSFTGRYVRVQLSGSQYLSLAEVQVSQG